MHADSMKRALHHWPSNVIILILAVACVVFAFAWATDLFDNEPHDLMFVSNTMHTPEERQVGDTVEMTNLWCNNTDDSLQTTFTADITGENADGVIQITSTSGGIFEFPTGCVPILYQIEVTELQRGGTWHQTGLILNGRSVGFETEEWTVDP